MLTMCFRPMRHRILAGLVLAVGLLLSQSVPAAPPSGSAPDSGSPASSLDLRPAFEKWGLTPRVQGRRNTCSVFTVAGALEYALASKTNHATRLSAEFLNWASNQAMRDTQDGGFFSDLWRGFTIYGACPEQDMPYQDKFDPERAPSEEAKDHARQLHEIGLQLHWIKAWNRNTGLTDKQFAAVKQVLNRQWPVCGGFRWPKVVRWKDDVLEMAPPEGVFDGHSVLMVGYRDDPQQPRRDRAGQRSRVAPTVSR